MAPGRGGKQVDTNTIGSAREAQPSAEPSLMSVLTQHGRHAHVATEEGPGWSTLALKVPHVVELRVSIALGRRGRGDATQDKQGGGAHEKGRISNVALLASHDALGGATTSRCQLPPVPAPDARIKLYRY